MPDDQRARLRGGPSNGIVYPVKSNTKKLQLPLVKITSDGLKTGQAVYLRTDEEQDGFVFFDFEDKPKETTPKKKGKK